MKLYSYSGAGLVAAALLLAGCSSSSSSGGSAAPPPSPAAEPTADVRFVHASPDAPDVNIASASTVLAESLAYGEATGFLTVAAETVEVGVDALLPSGPVTVIGPVELELAEGTRYSILAIGETASIEALVIARSEAPVEEGSVRVQVVHGAPNAPEVDVFVTGPDDLLEQAVPLGRFAFGEALDPVEVPGGAYRVRVTLAGELGAVAFDSGAVELPGGADLLVVAIENTGPGESPIRLLAADGEGSFQILDESTPAELRVVHASPDAPEVDVVVNDDFANPVLTNVPFGAVSDYLSVPSGVYNVKVTAAGNAGAIVIDEDLQLEAGTRYSVYASDYLGSIAPLVLTDDDRRLATAAKVRIVHTAPGAGLVDIYVTEPDADITALEPAFTGVDFGDETGYVSLAGGSYDVTVTPAGTTTAALGPVTVDLAERGVYTAAARDAEGGGAPFGLILLDDFVQ